MNRRSGYCRSGIGAGIPEELAVDGLRAALELATAEERQEIAEILFRPRFNPLDYLSRSNPEWVWDQHPEDCLDAIEDRFRFLAADGLTVIRGQALSVHYGDVLVQVCRHLKIPYDTSFRIEDLEVEIYLHILQRTWRRIPQDDRLVLQRRITSALGQSLPATQVAALADPLRLVFEGGGALAVTSVLQPWVMKTIARQFALQVVRYQLAQETLRQGGAWALRLQGQLAAQSASRGLMVTAARYTAVRSVFAVVTPALWTWFIADLGWRTIATNYGRIIPVIFTLAQIRLLRDSPYPTACAS
jgi:uncharacterized protein YaaW (UPF0174 family)